MFYNVFQFSLNLVQQPSFHFYIIIDLASSLPKKKMWHHQIWICAFCVKSFQAFSTFGGQISWKCWFYGANGDRSARGANPSSSRFEHIYAKCFRTPFLHESQDNLIFDMHDNYTFQLIQDNDVVIALMIMWHIDRRIEVGISTKLFGKASERILHI